MNRYEDPCLYFQELQKYDRNKSQVVRRVSQNDLSSNVKDRQLYELCQQLTRQNRLLKKQNEQLKKRIERQDSEGKQPYLSQIETQQFRAANYQCYKKKSAQLISSVKLLHKFYSQRCSIQKTDKLLDNFMNKLKNGQSNIIIELVRLFDESIKENESIDWNIDELERESSQYQNQLLRKHINKMNKIIVECIYHVKRDLMQTKDLINHNREKISLEINHYCQKYANFNQQPSVKIQKEKYQQSQIIIKEEIKNKPVLQNNNKCKPKKNTKKSKLNDENGFSLKLKSEKMILQQKDSLQRKHIQPNIKQRLIQSLAQANKSGYHSVPHSIPLRQIKQEKIAKPPSQPKKYQNTIVDQLKTSKNTGNYSIATPKSRNSASKSHMKESSLDLNFKTGGTPNWNSQSKSSRKYYR